jgi:hypothetical protein
MEGRGYPARGLFIGPGLSRTRDVRKSVPFLLPDVTQSQRRFANRPKGCCHYGGADAAIDARIDSATEPPAVTEILDSLDIAAIPEK